MPTPEQDSAKDSETRYTLSKEAWAAISAIAVAFIGAAATVFSTVYKQSPDRAAQLFADPAIASGELKPAEIPLGRWSGMAREPSGSAFPIAIEISQTCRQDQKCGRISVPQVPCRGQISLVKANNVYYEFAVSDFDANSDPKACKNGPGERLHFRPDGSVEYKATYSNAEGLLPRDP